MTKNITFTYDPYEGKIYKNKKETGTKNYTGYLVLRYNKKVVYAHRLAWYLYYGVWPTVIDHVNGNRIDNRIENLREVNYLQNAQNMTGKHVGAHLHKKTGLYRSSIMTKGKTKHLGYFKTAEEASAEYTRVKQLLHTSWRT